MCIEGRLTDKSYIYSNLCQIAGGFAFYTWFKGVHEGDFVLSVGGYHPLFKKPGWYPDVPRLELKYQITPEFYIKGLAYFALTPSTFMAGGALDARFESGSLAAWFLLTVDFLISWQPYHYDARVSVTIGAQWKIFKTEANATLEIWGPEFSGIAHVDWIIFSFTIPFGSSTSRSANPIGWSDFKQAFLPSDERQVVNARIVQGTIGSAAGDLPVVNAAQLTVDIESLIPIKTIVHAGTTQPATPVFGVAPMDLKTVATSSLSITVTRLLGSRSEDVTGDFDFEPSKFPRTGPISKKLPKALWGLEFQAAMDQDGTLDAVVGYRFAAKIPLDGNVASLKRSGAAFDLSPTLSVAKDDGSILAYIKVTPPGTDPDQARRDPFSENLFGQAAHQTLTNRKAILAALGIDDRALGNLNESVANSFVFAPQIVTLP